MDEVFRALNDPSRRRLLDALFADDGQTLVALCRHLPEMTRFGVMSHLRVLEDAGLVTTRKVGRNKHHYLNPVPIRLVHDRWIGKYTAPVVSSLAAVKTRLERGEGAMTAPVHVYTTYVAARPEAVWTALVDGDHTVQYYYGTRVVSDWRPGSPLAYRYPDGSVAADGEVIAAAPPHRLEMTFHPRWDQALDAAGPVRMVWLVEDAGQVTKLSVELHDVDPTGRTMAEFTAGLPHIVAGLKTLLETGAPLPSG